MIAFPGVSHGLQRTTTPEFLSDAGDPLICIILFALVNGVDPGLSHPSRLAGGDSSFIVTLACTIL